MQRWVATVFCAVALLFALAERPALGEEKPTLVVNLTSDDVWTEQMALAFARNIQDDGYPVVVFLNVRAVTIANTKVPQHRGAITGKTAAELIAEIIEKGGRVFVCPACTRQAGLELADRLPGIEPGGPEFRRILMAPGTRVISF